MREASPHRSPQASLLAALDAASSARFPGDDGGNSLAEMAQRDLDAALQLLADRAQYITGSSGAAIALVRGGGDMMCRASTGANAPELGSLLSTEFGLSGESVRTRRILRCDDAERDARVNREVCRDLGIASVVVMPVVQDDKVLGVFELFSGKANAFGVRDLSALQRLSEMVETAVKLAQVAQEYPQRVKGDMPSAPEQAGAFEAAGMENLDLDIQGFETPGSPKEVTGDPETGFATASSETLLEEVHERNFEGLSIPAETPAVQSAPSHPALDLFQDGAAKRPLFWSAAENLEATPTELESSRVPAAFRHLRKCEACGFPVSAERVLCVECEEKKWRGQLPRPQTAATASRAGSGAATAAAPARETTIAAALEAARRAAGETPRAVESAALTVATAPVSGQPGAEHVINTEGSTGQNREVVFSGGIEPSESWLSANKYIICAILLIASVVAGILFLR